EVPKQKPEPGVSDEFWRIMREGVARADAADVPLTFVFLPSKPTCESGVRHPGVAALIARTAAAGMDYIDAGSLLEGDSCGSLFSTRRGAHLTRYGYSRLADLIWRHLEGRRREDAAGE